MEDGAETLWLVLSELIRLHSTTEDKQENIPVWMSATLVNQSGPQIFVLPLLLVPGFMCCYPIPVDRTTEMMLKNARTKCVICSATSSCTDARVTHGENSVDASRRFCSGLGPETTHSRIGQRILLRFRWWWPQRRWRSLFTPHTAILFNLAD